VRDPDALQARLPRIENQLEALGLQVDLQQWRAAQRLSPAHAPVVSAFLETVEPARNHAHNHTILAMLRGNAHPPPQPLTSLADAAFTDGPQVRRFELQVKRLVGGDARDAATIRAQLTAWRDNDAAFREIAKGAPDLEAGLPASADTAELAREGLAALDALLAHQPLSAETRARAAECLARAAKFEAASSRPLFAFMRPQPPGDLIEAVAPGVGMLVDAAGRMKP
jgi:hypothetical protein